MLKIPNVQIKNPSVLDATLKGYKPACIMSSFAGFPVTKNLGPEFDKISIKRNCQSGEVAYNDYILNKKMILQIIKENMSIFSTGLKTKRNSSPEIVYDALIDSLKNQKTEHDLVGIILGFPKQNSMIFYLEKFTGLKVADRTNLKIFKDKLLDTLHKENSPYANIDREELNRLENSIHNINRIKYFHNIIYDFIEYTKEPSEINRIKTTTREYKKTVYSPFFNILA